jgi:hypothetical protein
MAHMAIARRNPEGLPAPAGIQLVQVGEHGKFVHMYDPVAKMHACKSGKNAGRGGKSGAMVNGDKPLKLYATKSRNITCYRCAKLAEMNLKSGRKL